MVIQLISEFRFNLDLKPSNISVIILYFSFGTVKFDDPLRQGYESFFLKKNKNKTKPAVSYVTYNINSWREREEGEGKKKGVFSQGQPIKNKLHVTLLW